MKKKKTSKTLAPDPTPAAEKAPQSTASLPSWLPWLGWFALALTIVCIAYGPALNGAFLFDDIALGFRADPNYHVENFKILDAETGEELRG